MSDTATTSAVAPPPAQTWIDRLNDFPDRLPPMLVKELRQGLRARTFVAVFLGLQLFLGLIMLIATSASGMNGAGEMVSRIIFLFFSIAVLFVQPLRGINALHAEIKSTTLDMMVLTKLNAQRIVLGKCTAIIGQTLLLFISIIPYLILRYFFGGMNLFAELLALGSIFYVSCCLTAINVGISANPAIWLRGLVPLALAIGSIFFMGVMMEEFEDMLDFFALDQNEFLIAFFCGIAAVLYLSWFVFTLGVSAIAPMAENHSTLNRIIALGIVVIATVSMIFNDVTWEAIPVIAGLIALPAAVIALTEPQQMLPRVTLPFTKRGFMGRVFGRFFYPCWSAGMFYTSLLIILLYGLSAYALNTGRSGYYSFGVEEFSIMNSLIGCVLFPAVCLLLLEKKIVNRIGFYIVALIAVFALSLAIFAVAEGTDNENALWIFCWLPPTQLFMIDRNKINDSDVMLVGLIVNAILLGYLMIQAFVKWPAIRETEEEALSIERQ